MKTTTMPFPIAIIRECRWCGHKGPLRDFKRQKLCRFGYGHKCRECSKEGSRAANQRWLDNGGRHHVRLNALKYKFPEQEDFDLPDECECYYCGEICRPTADHIIPRYFARKGIVDASIVGSAENIIPACFSCNDSKDNRLPNDPELLDKAAKLLGADPVDALARHVLLWEPPKQRDPS